MPIHGYPGNIVTANPTAPTVDSASGVWTTEQALQNIANWPMPLQQISRSLRFNSADSAYLNRTPASASNRKTWTWSGWIKLSSTSNGYIFGVVDSNDSDTAAIAYTGNQFSFQGYTVNYRDTTALYRDFSAWYHLVVALDTTQATAANRVKMYVNGVEVTSFAENNNPSQNADLGINTATEHSIGRRYPFGGGGVYFNGYLTEINFIDGLALDPSYFGFTDPNGIWQPRAYKGAYGTNGFYLNFSDNSGTTSTTLGKDSSGNGNNWTPNNFSVTAGAGNDSLVDTPTNYGTDTGAGGEVRGNYCTLNPTVPFGTGSIVNGNLQFGGSNFETTGTIGIPTTGKWYFEYLAVGVSGGGNGPSVGISGLLNSADNAYDVRYTKSGNKRVNGASSAYGTTWSANDVIGVAVNSDTNTVTFYLNNVSQGNITATSGIQYYPVVFDNGSNSNYLNFGQRPFAYTAPSGFKALCTQNLPEPTIVDGGEYFGALLWSGDDATGRTIATGQSGVTGDVDFTPDLAWIKSRSNATNHLLTDILRGGTAQLRSNTTDAESQFGDVNLTFVNGGFTNAGSASNESGRTFVAWNWKANGAGVSNTAGTITSTVSANTDSGFSIVTYTGNSTAGATIGHGLGVAPGMVIIKNRSAVQNWPVAHKSLAANNLLLLDTTNSTISAGTRLVIGNSTTFTVGDAADYGITNQSGQNYVAYCFAAIPGYSAFGSYTGNGSADGPFVYLGFKPNFLLVKKSDGVENWIMLDGERSSYNVVDKQLLPNTSDAEGTITRCDFLSNGFKVRAASTAFNSGTMIYAAFASNPFKISRAR